MPADDRFHDLERDLAAAGDRARSSDPAALPDRGFSDELRGRLLSQLPDRGATVTPQRDPRPRTGWSLGSLFRVPRFAPVLIAASLVFAAAVAGRQLYLAVGSGATPTPVPSISVGPSPSEAESVAPTLEPSEEPTLQPTPVPSAVPTPVPTVKPTPVPAPKPTPVPTPVMGSLSLWATTCNGGALLDWSMYEGAGAFDHYTTLRSTSPEIPAAYPPSGGAVDPGTTYTAYPEKTSGFDAGVDPGFTYYYRAMAFNADDGVIATSSVVSAMGKPVKPLGGLSVSAVAEGTKLAWTPYGGLGDCFTYYKIAYSEIDTTPAYLDGDPYLAAIGDQAASTFTTADLLSGHTYYIRVQAIRSTHTGSFLVGETDVATYTVP